MNIFWVIFALTICGTLWGFYLSIKEKTLDIALLIGSLVIGFLLIGITSELKPEFILFAWLTGYALIMLQGMHYLYQWMENIKKSTKHN